MMAIFLDYKIAVIPNLSVYDPNQTNNPTVLLIASSQSYFVTDITVCNTSKSRDIRVNLVLDVTNELGVSTSAYRLKNVLVKASASINLMQLLVDNTAPSIAGSSLILVGSKTDDPSIPFVYTKLKLFTDSPTQLCDCTVTYAILNETPWGGY